MRLVVPRIETPELLVTRRLRTATSLPSVTAGRLVAVVAAKTTSVEASGSVPRSTPPATSADQFVLPLFEAVQMLLTSPRQKTSFTGTSRVV